MSNRLARVRTTSRPIELLVRLWQLGLSAVKRKRALRGRILPGIAAPKRRSDVRAARLGSDAHGRAARLFTGRLHSADRFQQAVGQLSPPTAPLRDLPARTFGDAAATETAFPT